MQVSEFIHSNSHYNIEITEVFNMENTTSKKRRTKATIESEVATNMDDATMEPAKKPRKPRTSPVQTKEVKVAELKDVTPSLSAQSKPKNLILLVTVFLLTITSLFHTYRLVSLQKEIDVLTLRMANLLELEDFKYVTDNKLVINDAAKLWSMPESEYLVYFYSTDCSYCKELEKRHLIPFIRASHTDNIKIYFVSLNENKFLYADDTQYKNGFIEKPTPANFYIIGTPTMMWMKNGEAVVYLGNDKIPLLLKEFIK